MNDNETPFTPDYDAIRAAVATIVEQSHGAMLKAGWWTNPKTGERLELTPAVIGQKISLIHSEISEALEADRKTLMDDKLPHRPGVEVEFADALLRQTDTIGVLGLTEEFQQALIAVLTLPRPAVAFAMALRSMAEMSAHLGYDLPGATAEKAAFNAVRQDHKMETRRLANGKGY